ncbi:ABC transporter permease [Rhodobacter sp. 24-YEA-8]|uniref:ABC transporter permease n=1 Tax=Rhodobacter sp. 24-YEA-8 TaxID=1884310 RepID=UPI00089800B9|nr:ABC transporter permease [Rhodobacter sp. 24-YEA-8]SEB84709.1 peptide/nickel transport system permease protein [Rhodobacter sp. 24-YEA-8]
MTAFLLRKLGWAAATMLTVSILVYLALEVNVDDVAAKVLGQFSTEEQREAWLLANGYRDPLVLRYGRWLVAFLSGDWGLSSHFRAPVIEIIPARLGASLLLGACALLVMVPTALLLGVIAGMRPNSMMDRVVSVFAILSTSVPDFASAVLLSAIFVFWLGVLPGTSTMLTGFSLSELVLPVAVLALYSTGYLARITRTAMAEVMASHYVRTARLKGAGTFRIVFRHALRNALIVPATVVMMQVPWLLSGVIVVEVFFAYKGFGSLLYDAALNSDVYLIEACAMVSVVVVVLSQILSDLAYVWLNPRISLSGAERSAGVADA